MKPPPFDYARPSTLQEALDLLTTPGAKALAGGQSLLPLLNLRLAAPSLLVDVASLPGLDRIEANGGGLTVGALVRHHRLLEAPLPLLAQAARHVGHVAIRNRGTIGGSLVHADPTAELATAAIALDAELRLTSKAGERTVRAREFFQGPFLVDLAEEELLTEITIPPRPPGERSAFLEVAPRQGDFAIAGVAVLARVDHGALTGVTVAWSGAAPAPVLAPDLGAALEGAPLTGDRVERACREAADRLQPPADVRTSSEYRKAALGVLAARAVREAAAPPPRPSPAEGGGRS